MVCSPVGHCAGWCGTLEPVTWHITEFMSMSNNIMNSFYELRIFCFLMKRTPQLHRGAKFITYNGELDRPIVMSLSL